MNKGDFDTACAKFAESLALEEAPGTLLNLGECEERRGHLVASEANFRRAAGMFTNPQKQRFASEQASRVSDRIPRFVVKAATSPGLVVREGDKAVEPGTSTPHDPGEITLHVEAPGRRPKEVKATLAERAEATIDVGPLEPEVVEPPPLPPKPAPRPMSPLSIAGLAVAGVGVASLAVGAVTGVMALGRASTVKEHCDNALACDAEGVDAASSGSTLSTVSTITVAAGAGFAIGGGVLFLLGRRSKAPEPALAGRPVFLPNISPSFAGVFVGQRF